MYRKYNNTQVIEINNLKFKVEIKGYIFLWIFNKATSVNIISDPLTININL